MSLYKQLWLAILLLLAVVFSISFLVTTLSAKTYLQEQLAIKNADNATALALSLTQQGADPVLVEVTVAAQFDTGFYELIELTDPRGRTVVRRVDDQPVSDAPAWFMRLFPIDVEPGIAAIQSGWKQAGTLTLRSHSRFAYAELWHNTLKLAGVFLAAALLAGFIGNSLLKRILRPLAEVVQQAEAIRERRYVSIDEPGTLEFRQLVGAMNALSAHVKMTLAQEAKRLEKWQREAHVDKITGLRNREPFLSELQANLSRDDVNASGTLCIVRIAELAKMNETYGRRPTDRLLHEIGAALIRITEQHNGWSACRLNGSDFAVLAPRKLEAEDLGRDVQAAVVTALRDHDMRAAEGTPAAATEYSYGETASELLTRLDSALRAVEQAGRDEVAVTHKGDIPHKPLQQQSEEWRKVIEGALQQRRFSLAFYPVLDLERRLIHNEAPARLNRRGESLSAGVFLPWVNRVGLSLELDKQVVELAMDAIARDGQPVAINLTSAALKEQAFLSWLEAALSRRAEAASKLWMEIPEALAFRHVENFKRLCTRAKAHGVHMGIEHMGHQLSELGQLHDVGLDYLKIDATFVRDIQQNPGNQTLLRTLCTIGHSIGVRVFAEGVSVAAEWDALADLGIDGGTGTGVSL